MVNSSMMFGLMRRIVWQTSLLNSKMSLFVAVCFWGLTLLGDWRVTKYAGDELKKVHPYTAYTYETNGCRIVFYDTKKDFKLICPPNKIFNWTPSSQKGMEGRSGCEITVGLYKKGKLVDRSVLAMYDGRTLGEGLVLADINKKRMEAGKLLKEEFGISMSRPIYKTALDISRVYNCLRTPDCHVRITAPYFDDIMEMDIVVPYCKDLPMRRFKK